MKPGRVVSKRAYMAHQCRYIAKVGAGYLLLTLGAMSIVLWIFFFVWVLFLWPSNRHMEEVFGISKVVWGVLVGGAGIAGSCLFVRWGMTLADNAELMEPVVPLTRFNRGAVARRGRSCPSRLRTDCHPGERPAPGRCAWRRQREREGTAARLRGKGEEMISITLPGVGISGISWYALLLALGLLLALIGACVWLIHLFTDLCR